MLRVISQPTATHPRQSPVENTILDNADNHLPSTIKLYVCRLNDENVVNPPQIPTTSNCCSAVAIPLFETCARRPARMPIIVEPAIFTTRVPNGNVSPKRWATRPDHQNRHILPAAPPKNTSIIANSILPCEFSCAARVKRHGAHQERARQRWLLPRY
jgi:hypothetical protein